LGQILNLKTSPEKSLCSAMQHDVHEHKYELNVLHKKHISNKIKSNKLYCHAYKIYK
jgi:hypothetical protein